MPDPKDNWTPEEVVQAVYAYTAEPTYSNRKTLLETLNALKALWLVVQPGRNDSFKCFAAQNSEGEAVLAVFTDAASAVRWCESPPAFMFEPPEKIWNIAVSGGYAEIWINPSGLVGVRIDRAEFEALACGEQLYESLVNKDRPLMIETTRPPFPISEEYRTILASANIPFKRIYSVGLSVDLAPSRPCFVVIESKGADRNEVIRAIRDLKLVGEDGGYIVVTAVHSKDILEAAKRFGEIIIDR